MNYLIKCLIPLFLIGIFASCNNDEKNNDAPSQDLADYFPLEIGNYWIYGEDYDDDDSYDDEIIRNTVIDDDYVINGTSYSLIESVDESGTDRDSLYVRKSNNDYIIRAEEFLEFEAEITDDYSEIILLKANAVAGTKWQYDFTLNSITVDDDIIDDFEIQITVMLELLDRDETIITPAGTFNDVLVVEQKIDLPVLFDEYESFLPITRFYFAPDIGIVSVEFEYQEDDQNQKIIEKALLIEYSLN